MLDGSERGQAAAAERGRVDGVEVADRKQVAPEGDEHVLGVAAVLEHPCLPALRADHLLALQAEAALAAAPRRVDEHVADALDLACDLVAEDERQRRGWEVALDHVQIGVAHADGRHLDDGSLAGARRQRPILDFERTVKLPEDDRLHSRSVFDGEVWEGDR